MNQAMNQGGWTRPLLLRVLARITRLGPPTESHALMQDTLSGFFRIAACASISTWDIANYLLTQYLGMAWLRICRFSRRSRLVSFWAVLPTLAWSHYAVPISTLWSLAPYLHECSSARMLLICLYRALARFLRLSFAQRGQL